MSLADFFNIRDDLKLVKKFPKESKSALYLRDFTLKIIEIIGGRTVHPMTSIVGGFTKIPAKDQLKKAFADYKEAKESALVLVELFKNLKYPKIKRETDFCSSFSQKEYLYHKGEKVKIGDKIFSGGDFFSNEIEEDLKIPPAKRVEFQGRPYMLGAIARVKNNQKTLEPEAKAHLEEFRRKNDLKENELFENTFYNTFYEALEIIHFLKEAEKNFLALLEEKETEPFVSYKPNKGSGLGILEAPRGTLFSYFEIDRDARILNCTIITPTAQFLRNLEEDLKVLLPDILKLPEKEKVKKVKTLIRAYDPCIACAVH
jgi:coenzyme F420-reducing hydrogenase alpha subunit